MKEKNVKEPLFEGVDTVLASRSPRRRELLGTVTDKFEIVTCEVDESLPSDVHPREGVELLAIRKGRAVRDELGDGCLIISADTLVEMDGIPLGKPRDVTEAREMLRSLSGRTHNVHTGTAVHYRGGTYSGVATTSVTFRTLTEGEIDEYIATGEPMDKAGAYGIQGGAGRFVEGYLGDLDTVIGLSRRLLCELISDALEDKND